MYDFIKGEIRDLSPTFVVLENNGIGYYINISLHTYSNLSEKHNVLLYVYELIREDTYQLFGFFDKIEREIFTHLISVSGVGANTARVMLSSLSSQEIKNAIINGNINILKAIKGIGAKTAERIVVDLRDKLGKVEDSEKIDVFLDNTIKDEALSALVMLGFPKNKVDKVITIILKENTGLQVEGLIKEALKRL
ncbi:MAG: Holliday junction branch migration protein RuvA [Bacteroidales bacterium]|nr:Holliday junction branch migration protein RuvA [Bacteroidales bacterium]